jgi:hypothetical protein
MPSSCYAGSPRHAIVLVNERSAPSDRAFDEQLIAWARRFRGERVCAPDPKPVSIGCLRRRSFIADLVGHAPKVLSIMNVPLAQTDEAIDQNQADFLRFPFDQRIGCSRAGMP